MMRIALSIPALLLTLGQALSQEPVPLGCEPRAALVARLHDGWGETNMLTGYGRDGLFFEVFAKIDGTWTLVVTDKSGRACPIASGDAWQGFMLPQGEAG